MEHYFGVAKEEGLGTKEIGAVQAIVMAVAAGKIRAQFREVRRRGHGEEGQGNEHGAAARPSS
jgi:hypothetical protein